MFLFLRAWCLSSVARVFGSSPLKRPADYSGKLISKKSVEVFNSSRTEHIISNKKLFFEDGIQDGGNVSTVGLFNDVYCLKGKLFFLKGAKKFYEEILVVDRDTFALIDRYQ
ncbi:MAG: hypothetical protein GY765_43965 [bacterium]|nr:hypothetical protein [bacterium]